MRVLSVTGTLSSSAPWPMKMGTCCAASGTACAQSGVAIDERSAHLARTGSSEVPSVSSSDRASETANTAQATGLAEAVRDIPELHCERLH